MTPGAHFKTTVMLFLGHPVQWGNKVSNAAGMVTAGMLGVCGLWSGLHVYMTIGNTIQPNYKVITKLICKVCPDSCDLHVCFIVLTFHDLLDSKC